MLLLLGAIFLGSFAYSQESMSADKLSKNWTLLTTQNGVEVYLKKDFCDVGAKDPFTYAHVKFVNTNSSDVSAEFNFELHYELDCVGCGNINEYRKILTIPGNGSIEGSCDSGSETSLLVDNPYQQSMGDLLSIKVSKLIIE